MKTNITIITLAAILALNFTLSAKALSVFAGFSESSDNLPFGHSNGDLFFDDFLNSASIHFEVDYNETVPKIHSEFSGTLADNPVLDDSRLVVGIDLNQDDLALLGIELSIIVSIDFDVTGVLPEGTLDFNIDTFRNGTFFVGSGHGFLIEDGASDLEIDLAGLPYSSDGPPDQVRIFMVPPDGSTMNIHNLTFVISQVPEPGSCVLFMAISLAAIIGVKQRLSS